MSRFGKISTVVMLALPLVVGGCRPNRKTATPEDYYPLIQVAFEAGAVGAMIARNEAIEKKNFAACVAADVLADAFDSAGDALQARISDKIEIPAFEMDLTDCLALRPATDEGDESARLAGPVVLMTMGPAEEEKPTEEAAPAEEEKPTEEAAPAEEEKPTEEAAAETPAEEVDATLDKGNPDAAVLVEAIAGITLTAALYYANKLKTANCKKGVAALAAIHYVNGMIKPIADEIAEPDGKVSVPAVTIDFSECK